MKTWRKCVKESKRCEVVFQFFYQFLRSDSIGTSNLYSEPFDKENRRKRFNFTPQLDNGVRMFVTFPVAVYRFDEI